MVDPEQAENFKNQGNEAFKNGEYLKAVGFYTEALGKATLN